ncbi:hypothetical protein PWG15_26560 (plasmid) [Ensifer adhaerens]|uniref:hypothetical protein n=1 Tax=Ensifer adhaerens TaxID=106592 RepID=UPI0023A97845|nr:hypothetical protein [Ensifer adhaerens]WDZ79051.1 hypothetical protein PWG15_26560 [Ensifer adhaerens]
MAADQWTRAEAEARISEVFNAAKTRGPQRISEVGGTFELTFVRARTKKLSQLLLQDGPLEDGELDDR